MEFSSWLMDRVPEICHTSKTRGGARSSELLWYQVLHGVLALSYLNPREFFRSSFVSLSGKPAHLSFFFVFLTAE